MTYKTSSPWIITISPAKKIQTEIKSSWIDQSKYIRQPLFLDQAFELVARLKKLDISALEQLMSISRTLAETNHARFLNFPEQKLAFASQPPALYQFIGDVYKTLNPFDFDQDALTRTQSSLYILSGLYGMLNAFDGLYPYRLEMGCKVGKLWGFDLYDYWQDLLTDHLNRLLSAQEKRAHIDLASNEYAQVIDKTKLIKPSIECVFAEGLVDGRLRVVGIKAKKARGAMARYLLTNPITSLDQLKAFSYEGYRYSPEKSRDDRLVFINHHKNI